MKARIALLPVVTLADEGLFGSLVVRNVSAAPGRGEQMVAWSLAAVAAVLAVGGSLLNLYGRIPLLASISTQDSSVLGGGRRRHHR